MTITHPTRPSPSTPQAPRSRSAAADIVGARQPPTPKPATGQAKAATRARNERPEAAPEAVQAIVAQCQEAANDCAHVVKAFTHIRVEDLFKSTRGAACEAFPRQLMMAGLVSELGFSSLTVGRAVGRDKATVDHACRIIEGLRGGGLEAIDLVRLLGEAGVREYLGGDALLVSYGDDGKAETILAGGERVEEFLEHAEALIDDLFAAFRVVAIKGAAYRGEIERLKLEAAARAAG